jgi:hypothetical protein
MALAIAWFACNGYVVAIPLTDTQPFDLIVSKDGRLFRVQVKRTTYIYPRRGCYQLNLKTWGVRALNRGSRKAFDKGAVDILFVVTPAHKYLIPIEFVVANNTLRLTPKYDSFIVE